MKKLSVKHRAYAAISSAITASFLMPTMAFAFTKPGAPSDSNHPLFYEVYDIVVNKLLNGPVGFAIGVLLIIYGGTKVASSQYFSGLACVIAGSIVIKAEDIAVALGMIIT